MSHNCPLGGRCCQGEGEEFWLNEPQKLFCSYSPIPHGNLASGERLNALTRFVIYLSILMLISGYKFARAFFILGIIFIILIYITTGDKEGYAVVKEIGVDGVYHKKEMHGVPINKSYSDNLSLKGADNFYKAVDESLIPVYEPNENNYMGSAEDYLKATSLDFEGGKRDVEADIQYYTPKTGVNRRTMIAPVIPPRIFDQEEFGKKSNNISRINQSNITDLTSDLDLGMNHGMDMEDPFSLGNPYTFKKRNPNAVTMMNRIEDRESFNGYTSGQFMDTGDSNYRPSHPLRNDKHDDISAAANAYKTSQILPTENAPDNVAGVKREKVIEKFDFLTLNESEIIKDKYGAGANVSPINASYNRYDRSQPNTAFVNDQLLEASPTYTYTDSYFQQPERRIYLQNIQPNMYSYSMNQEPINSNIGITYNPQPVPRFLDQVNNAGTDMPLYTRIDPQLVRSDGTQGQINAQPLRTEWSANYSNYVAPEGSVNFEDIYDSRFNSYGDGYRNYQDLTSSTTKYYYSDVDRIRQPNFISRSNVDEMIFTTPQGQSWPDIRSNMNLDNIRPMVASQYDADDLFRRQDQMSLYMNKIDRTNYQQKYMPLRKTNNSSIGPM